VGTAVAQAPPVAVDLPKPEPAIPDAPIPEAPITVARLRQMLTSLDDNAELDESTKTELRELYTQSVTRLEQLDASRASIQQSEQLIREASDENIAAAKEQREAVSDMPELALPENAPLDQLEQQLEQAEAKLAKDKQALTKLAAESPRRDVRRAAIPKELEDATTELAEAKAKAALPLDPEVGPLMRSARQTLERVRMQSLEERIAALELEREAYDASDELLQIQHDIAAAEVADLAKRTQKLRDLVNAKRKQETDEQARAAERQATAAQLRVKPLAQLAERNAKLAEERRQLADDLAESSGDLEEVRDKLAHVTEQYDRTKSKVQAGRLSQSVGQILRQERGQLPSVQEHRRNMHLREPLRTEIEFTRYKLQDQRTELTNLPQRAEALAQQVGSAGANGMTPAEIEAEARELLTTERDYLDKLIADYKAYSQMLLELDEAEEDLVETTSEYSNFIAERVFWIRSASPLSLADVGPGLDAGRWLLSRDNWWRLGGELLADMRRNPPWWGGVLLLTIVLFVFQREARRRISQLGAEAERGSNTRFVLTARAAIVTLYIAIPWSTVVMFVAWRLWQSYTSWEFVRAFARGTAAMTGVYLPLEVLRQAARAHGLAESHFEWSPNVVRALRVNLRRTIFLAVPLVFVAAALEGQSLEPLWSASLGRVAFLGVMAIAGWLLHLVFRPHGRVMQELIVRRADGWLDRLRWLWYLLMLAGPIALAVAALAGYYYTAQALSLRLLVTVYFLIAVLLLRGLLMRWVLISRRRLAMHQLRERRTALSQLPATSDGEGASLAAVDEPIVDLATLSGQTRQLIDAVIVTAMLLCAWLIWADVLPALLILKSIPVWPGATELSLADVMFAAAVGVVTWVAAKNLPGLLELSVLKYLPLDAGARYASNTLARYAILCVGIVAISNILAVDWDRLQWLLAALGVGLGFGLQEIFANFVCGLILLFERPIRVGDIITLDDVTGTVTRIRMRATTITNWDRKELIVPNKELITGRLLNWTLSNQVNRLTIEVGIAYGSDTALAHRLLLKVADENRLVLKEPPPIATFEGFGDSTLNFTLRCFLPDLENRLTAIHELHTEIDQAFREAEIEIAFPQRDLHIRSMPTRIEQRLSDAATGSNGSAADKAATDKAAAERETPSAGDSK
ncbi:MAG: mechanosensitive ion channel, partial [Planctomycetales bacterium]|nr:mechanosensitive ion channel [Planctomycetales bacterium]